MSNTINRSNVANSLSRNGRWGDLSFLLGVHAILFLAIVNQQSFRFKDTIGFTLHDDAMISMRYARNLAAGIGLVWNPDERIEGITNLGWTLWMTILHLTNSGDLIMPLLVSLSNLAINLVIVALTYRAANYFGGRVAALVAGLLMCFSMPLLFWGAAGFETPLLTLLVSYAFFSCLRWTHESKDLPTSPTSTGLPASPLVALGIGYLVRPDAVVAMAVVMMVIGLWAFQHRSFRGFPLHGAVLALAIILAVQSFRLYYYGALVPNTAVLKIGAAPRTEAFTYLYRQLPDTIYPMYSCALILAWQWYRLGRILGAALIATVPVAYVVYVFYTSGDVFGIGRFFLPSLPLVAVATSLLLTSSSVTSRKGLTWLLACMFVLLAVAKSRQVYLNANRNRDAAYEQFLIAEALSKSISPEDPIAVGLAGGLPYYLPGHRFVDVYGKCDAYIARLPPHINAPIGHNKWDMNYVIKQRGVRAIVDGGYAPWATNEDFLQYFAANFHAIPDAREIRGYWLRKDP